MAIATVRDTKTGKKLRTVDTRTGRTLKSFDSKGKVTKDFTKKKKKSKSSSRSKPSFTTTKSGIKVFVGSDAPEDIGKSFGGQKILSTKKSKSGGKSQLKEVQTEIRKFDANVENRLRDAKEGKFIGTFALKQQGFRASDIQKIKELARRTKERLLQDSQFKQQAILKTKGGIEKFKQSINNRLRSIGVQPLAIVESISRFEDQLNKLDARDLLKNIKLPNQTNLTKQIAGLTLTPSQKKQALKEQTKLTISGKILKELTPFVNTDSQKTYTKINRGEKLVFNDFANMAFDIASIIPGAGFVLRTGFKTGKTTVKILKAGKDSKKFKFKLIVAKRPKAKLFTDTVLSIIKDVGATKRVTEGAKQFFQVDKTQLKIDANRLNFKDNKELYRNYVSFIGERTKDGKFRTDDVTKFLGLDYFNKSTVKAGQKDFRAFLKINGFNEKESLRLINNLENFRKARQLGQLFGFIKVEVSSETLARNLFKSGRSKTVSVGLAGAREGISQLATETFIQGGKVENSDILFAIITGVTGSLFFSKQASKGIKKTDILRLQKRVATQVGKHTTNKKTAQIVKGIVKNYSKKNNLQLSGNDINILMKTLTPADKKKILVKYSSNVFHKITLKKPRFLIKRKIKALTKPIRKTDEFVRSLVGDILDPFEQIGDKITDFNEVFSKKLIQKIKKQSKIKTKVKTGSKSKSKSIGKTRVRTIAFSKAETKISPKPETKISPKPETKIQPKPRPETKIQPKSKPRIKAGIKTKVKSKPRIKAGIKSTVKSKPKIKPKIKAKIVPFPIFKLPKKLKKGQRLSYGIKFREGGKIKTNRLALPINRAIKKGFGGVDTTLSRSAQLFVMGVTKIKDIPKPTSLLRKFRVTKGKQVLKFVEKSKFTLDTAGEKKKLLLSRLLKKKTRKSKRL